jgi:hypothetical protein
VPPAPPAPPGATVLVSRPPAIDEATALPPLPPLPPAPLGPLLPAAPLPPGAPKADATPTLLLRYIGPSQVLLFLKNILLSPEVQVFLYYHYWIVRR